MKSLTPLRGVAALAVLLFHAGVPIRGYLAVDLFFMLSGFVLMHAYGDIDPRSGYGSFVKARLARIYPVHLLMILFLLPFFGINERFSASALVQNLLLVQGPWYAPAGPSVSWNDAAWSLSVEWHAYLLFPLVAPFIARQSARTLRLIAIACLVIVEGLEFHLGTIGIVASPLVLVRGLPEFALGMILYRFFTDPAVRRHFESDAVCLAVCAALIGAHLVSRNDALLLLLLPLLLFTCAANDGRFASVLCGAPLRFLGEISFSLYMVQLVVRQYLYTVMPPGIPYELALVGATFAIAIPISRFVEYPARDWIKNPRWRQGAAKVALESPR